MAQEIRWPVDTGQVRFFRATDPIRPVVDQDKAQRSDKESGLPLWQVALVAFAPSGTATVVVKVAAAEKPAGFGPMDEVIPYGLAVQRYDIDGNGGMTHRADRIALKDRPGARAAAGGEK